MSTDDFHNLIYALIQVLHNFGAASVVGLAAYGLMRRNDRITDQRRLLLAMTIAWVVQGASGAIFGLSSLTFYGMFPDIHGIAVIALFVKITCVIAGFIMAFIGFRKSAGATQASARAIWHGSFSLAATAMAAAAFLRWFS